MLKHLQLVMNLLLTFSIPLVHNKWHITQVNFITKKINSRNHLFCSWSCYFTSFNGDAEKSKSWMPIVKKKVPVLALMPEYTRDVFRNYKSVEVQDWT